MNERTIHFTLKNIILYFLGVFILALGATISVSSHLGAGPWDTVSKNLSYLLGTELGYASGAISTILMLIVITYTKNWRLFGMVLPIIFVSGAILMWDYTIFNHFTPETWVLRGIFYTIGVLLIPLGLSLIITSNFPAFVFDELMIMFMNIFKTDNVIWIRVGIELLGITLGTFIGFQAGVRFGAVGPGSIVMAAMIGPLIGFYLKALKRYQDE